MYLYRIMHACREKVPAFLFLVNCCSWSCLQLKFDRYKIVSLVWAVITYFIAVLISLTAKINKKPHLRDFVTIRFKGFSSNYTAAQSVPALLMWLHLWHYDIQSIIEMPSLDSFTSYPTTALSPLARLPIAAVSGRMIDSKLGVVLS